MTGGHAMTTVRILPGDERASVTLELAAIAATFLISVTLALDVYAYQRARAGAAKMAWIVAEYAANQPGGLDWNELRSLGEALRRPQIGGGNTLVIRLTALHQGAAAGSAPTIPWVTEIPLGENAAQAATRVGPCPPRNRGYDHFGEEGERPVLPAGIDNLAGEDLVVVQLCARLENPGIAQNTLFDEVIYRVAAMPFVQPATRPPAAPAGEPQPEDAPSTEAQEAT